jgi:transcriptional regulator with XRE-family HTH domain
LQPYADFSLKDLHAALDERRIALGLTWPQAALEIGVSPSTVAKLATRDAAEADGVLRMLHWLGRSPESFVPGHPRRPNSRLPEPPPGLILRLDTARLHDALEAQLEQHSMSWPSLAFKLALGASGLKKLGSGGRASFPMVMRLTGWLSRPLAEFTKLSER